MEDKPPDQGTTYWVTLAAVVLTIALIVIAAALYL